MAKVAGGCRTMQIGAVGQLSPGNQSTKLSGSERCFVVCFDVDDVIGLCASACTCVCWVPVVVQCGACACATRQAIKPENAN